MSGYGLGQIIRLGGNLITTRLLAPELFGVMTFVTSIIIGLEMMSDMGVQQSIIRSLNADKLSFRRTAWVFQIGRNLILSVFCLLLATTLMLVQSFEFLKSDTVYNNPNLPTALFVIALSIAVSGLSSIDRFLAERNLDFGKFTLLQLSGQIFTVAAIVIWALLSPSIWALAGGTLLGSLFSVLLSHLLFPSPANRFSWDREAASELFHFGKWLLLSSTLGFITAHGDRFFLGTIMTSATFGCYGIALQLLDAGKMVIVRLGQLWFPLLSEKAREHPGEYAQHYYKIRQYQDVVVFFAAGFLIACGDLIISILYDARYDEAGWMLQILALSLIFVTYQLKSTMILVDGQSRVFSIAMTAKALTTLIAVPLGYYMFGLPAAIAIFACVEAPGTLVAFRYFQIKGILRLWNEILYFPLLGLGLLAGYLAKKSYIFLFGVLT